MEQFIGCDAHKKFSLFVAMNEQGEYGRAVRVSHERQAFREFLAELPAGSKIALETSGSYYWIVEEMERAGHEPHLAHALTAKRRMEGRHKTDERDARGLAMLLRNGTLPRVWIPPAKLRDEREMLRLRMSPVETRTRLKNRIHGCLLRYNVSLSAQDIYGAGGRNWRDGWRSCRHGPARVCWSNWRPWTIWQCRSATARNGWSSCWSRVWNGIG